MNRWNPNLYHKKGLKKGFRPEYLETLIRSGKNISSQKKPVIFTLAHLADCTDTQYSDLHAFVSRKDYHSKDNPHYRIFSIKKRGGGSRPIHAPHKVLKIVQSWIARNILSDAASHESAKAYKTGESIVDNASAHCGAEWLLKLDIRNFFHNISERQVYRVFRSMNYPALLSFEMARICTQIDCVSSEKRWKSGKGNYKIVEYSSTVVGCLPQGAPTSPMLSNLVCKDLDEVLFSMSSEHSSTYTRYADDLTFSFSNVSRSDIISFKRKVSNVLKQYGFEINREKTRLVPPGARKIVTGLLINSDKPAISRELKDKIKAELYYCHKYGVANHCKKNKYKSIIGFANHMNGLISFVNSVEPILADRYRREFEKLMLPRLTL